MESTGDETQLLTPLLVGSPGPELRLFRSDETAAAFLRRTQFRAPAAPPASALRLFFPHGLPRGAVLAYQSPPSAPLHLLLRAWLSHFLLPSEVSWDDRAVPVGGCHFGVVYFDFSYRIDIHALRVALEKQLEATLAASEIVLDSIAKNRIQEIVSTCLRRVTVVRCETHLEFLLHLRQLRTVVSQDETVRGLIIDSIDSLAHMMKLGEKVGLNQSPQICQVIEELANNYRMAVVSTQSEPQSRTDSAPPVHLGSRWNKLVTHRFLVSSRAAELHIACVQSPSLSSLDRMSAVFPTPQA